MSSVIIALTFLGGSAVASAAVLGHDLECGRTLISAPIEDVSLPAGWVWRDLEVGSEDWRGSAEWAGGDIRAASLTLVCADDAPTLLQRRAEVREAFGFELLAVDTGIGDRALAWRVGPQGPASLDWVSGDVLGMITGQWNASLDELMTIAANIDEQLP